MLDWFKRMAVAKDQQAEALTEAKVERLVGRFAPHPNAPASDLPTPMVVEARAPHPEELPSEEMLLPEMPESGALAGAPVAGTAGVNITEELPHGSNEPPAAFEEPPANEPAKPDGDALAFTAEAPEPAAEPSVPVAETPEPVASVAAPSTDAPPLETAAESASNDTDVEIPTVFDDLPAPRMLAEVRVPPAAVEIRPAPPPFGDTRILVVASQKGGSGKTTLADHLAIRASQAGLGPAVLIDTDPQGSLTEWWVARGDASLALETVKLNELDSHLTELRRQGAALIIIDTPPALTTSIEQVIGVADLVLVPARPSPHDLRAIGATVEMIRRAGKSFLFVVNGAAPRANITAEAVAALSEHGQVAPVILYQRTDYAASMIDGRTVMEAAPSSRSTQEITDLWNYVQPRVNLRAAA